MATELLPHTDALLSDNNGKFVILNCKILQFKSKKESWMQNEEQNEKKRKLFAEIIVNDETVTEPKSKQKKKKEKVHNVLFILIILKTFCRRKYWKRNCLQRQALQSRL